MMVLKMMFPFFQGCILRFQPLIFRFFFAQRFQAETPMATTVVPRHVEIVGQIKDGTCRTAFGSGNFGMVCFTRGEWRVAVFLFRFFFEGGGIMWKRSYKKSCGSLRLFYVVCLCVCLFAWSLLMFLPLLLLLFYTRSWKYQP